MKKAGGILAAGFLLSLTGCASQQLATSSAVGTPPDDLAGRWMLSMPQAPACGLNLSGGFQGRIVPEGGCPGDFFTSRHWAFEQDELVIRDHNSEALAQLRFAGDRFEGKSAKGLQVTIARNAAPAN